MNCDSDSRNAFLMTRWSVAPSPAVLASVLAMRARASSTMASEDAPNTMPRITSSASPMTRPFWPSIVTTIMVSADPLIPANYTQEATSQDYFPGVRQLCDEHGAVFILDEIKTGFRLARGGAQELYGIFSPVEYFLVPLTGDVAAPELQGALDIGDRNGDGERSGSNQ